MRQEDEQSIPRASNKVHWAWLLHNRQIALITIIAKHLPSAGGRFYFGAEQ